MKNTMGGSFLFLLLLSTFCVVPCFSTMSKIIVGTCCNANVNSNWTRQEEWTGQKLYVVGMYGEICQSSFYTGYLFPIMVQQWNMGRVTHLTISPDNSNGCFPGNVVPSQISSNPNAYILAGSMDTYITALGSALKTFLAGPDGTLGNSDDRRVYLRYAHELNGNWYPWSNVTNYGAAWRYVYNKIMTGSGLNKTHIQWIFEPIAPWEIGGDFELFWPGDAYVDWLSLDAYNSADGQKWYQPWERFDSMLYKFRGFRPLLPVMVSETGSYSGSPLGSNIAAKGQWLQALYPYLAGWNVQIVVYFNDDNGGDWPYFWTTDNVGQQNVTEDGTLYSVYPPWKTGMLATAYHLTSPTSARIMTDAEFLGQLPGYNTQPTLPRNLVMYANGTNGYDWQCTKAGVSSINLVDTTHPRPGSTYAMAVSMTSWGSLQLHHAYSGLNTSYYGGGFSFSIYTTQANVAMNIKPYNGSGYTYSTVGVTVPTANTWTTFNWTWSQLSVPSGIYLLGVYVQAASNSDQGTAYFDQIQFGASAVPWYH